MPTSRPPHAPSDVAPDLYTNPYSNINVLKGFPKSQVRHLDVGNGISWESPEAVTACVLQTYQQYNGQLLNSRETNCLFESYLLSLSVCPEARRGCRGGLADLCKHPPLGIVCPSTPETGGNARPYMIDCRMTTPLPVSEVQGKTL
ncbi:hypothetical protein J6590_027906 [Homalodisca vitripennis]|nr:hypothetical protein J6590_027906 [Homalodisca vitripennis]